MLLPNALAAVWPVAMHLTLSFTTEQPWTVCIELRYEIRSTCELFEMSCSNRCGRTSLVKYVQRR